MRNATVLVLGAGGREHALAWALARSPQVAQVYVAPGNAGTAWDAVPGSALAPAACVPVEASDTPALIEFARQQQVDLTVVGPEALLAVGVVDAFQAAGLRIFGPTQAATQLESSKVFAKTFMREHGIPTGDYAAFTSYDEARRYLASRPAGPVVVKADGLAAGKGVAVCATLDEAHAALERTMVAREFGAAGEQVIIEEHLSGREVSLLAFSDGRTVVPMPPARDHKRVNDGDQGPNTGGMGAYAPAPDIDSATLADLTRTVLQPAVAGMAARGTPYVGILYAGLIFTAEGPRLLEFNCRFGDPETQVILPLLSSEAGHASLFEIVHACTESRLHTLDVQWQAGACATVVAASPGYPGSYPKGLPISGLEQASSSGDVLIFHAGTARRDDGQVVTAGGRVLNVTAVGATLDAALNRAYEGMQRVCFDDMHYRRDIGWQDRQVRQYGTG